MIKIVFDVPAESGGALTILREYYELATKDKDNKWVFVISTPKLIEKDNIRVLNFPWIKKTWLHRLFFDYFIAHKLVKKFEANEIISLQNIVIPKTKIKQTLYLHQPLPFIEKRYRFHENPRFWVYQNLISKLIFKSIAKADTVIVQTNWMKKSASLLSSQSMDKFQIIKPQLIFSNIIPYKKDNEKTIFFYPASAVKYKNHEVIVNACIKLNQIRYDRFLVIFTLNGNENRSIKKLKSITDSHNLPIKFIGQISNENVYKYYSKSILVFPSYVETFGLPLLEAKLHNCPILASNSSFCHEILEGYDDVSYFEIDDDVKLFELMEKHIKKGIIKIE